MLFVGKTVDVDRSMAILSSKLISTLLMASENTDEESTIFFTSYSERSLRLYSETIYSGLKLNTLCIQN